MLRLRATIPTLSTILVLLASAGAANAAEKFTIFPEEDGSITLQQGLHGINIPAPTEPARDPRFSGVELPKGEQVAPANAQPAPAAHVSARAN